MTATHTLLAVAVATVWGVNFVVIDVGLRVFPPLFFVALRFALVALPAVFSVGPPRVPIRHLIGVGLFSGALQFGLLFVSISAGMPPGLSSLVIQLQVVFTIALASLTLGERPGPAQLLGAVVALAGMGVIATARTAVAIPLGALALCVAAGVAWAIGNVITRAARPPDAIAFLVWTATVTPLPVLGLSMLLEGPGRIATAATSLTIAAVLSILFVAFGATGFGFASWSYLMRHHPASTVAPFALLVPVVGMGSSVLFLGEKPSAVELAGAVVVLAGLSLVTLSGRRRRRRQRQQLA